MKRAKDIILKNRELYIISRTRLKSFCDFLVRNGIIDEIVSMNKQEQVYFKVGDKFFYVIEEGIYGRLNWKFSPQNSTQISFAFHIVDHCNLNCQMCNKFSPLAKENYVPKSVILRDAERLHKLTNGDVNRLIITGGEPLLHPKLEEILTGIHNIFPNTLIQLQTNGLLLPRMGREFYTLCKMNNTAIWLTKYPINFNYDAVENEIKSCECEVINSIDEVKTSWKQPMDLKGRQPKFLTLFCWMHSECVNVINGKITPCGFMHASHNFEEAFNISFERTEDDCLDINKVSSWAQVDEYLRKIQPFCRYCDLNNWEENIPWKISEGKMTEWIADEEERQ